MQSLSTEVEQQVQWLVDRAHIRDLVLKYARCADTKDWQGFADLFADDGQLMLPFGSLGKASMAESVERILKPFESTQHLFSNIHVDVDGDTASSNHYLQAVHVGSAAAPGTHADIGGWYDNRYRRTSDGWRITSVELTFVWAGGVDFVPGDPNQ